MFLNICIKSKFKLRFIIFSITVLLFAAAVFLMLFMIDKTKNGSKFLDKTNLTFDNYYAQYDMTVISNKNINTYSVKEWHKEGNMTKLEYLDSMKNVVTITLEGNRCNITNSGNLASFVTRNMIENRNVASLSTFGYLYNLECENCNCIKERHVKDKEIVIKLELKGGNTCKCDKIKENLNISSLELILVDGIPKNYIIYDKNKKEYISIVYNVYEKNIEI